MKKRMLYLFTLILTVGLILVGCGGSEEDKNKEGIGDADDVTEEGLSFRVAGQYPPDHPESLALEAFKEEVESNTDGAIEVSVYPANQLGDYTQVYEEVMQGTIEMALIDIPSQHDSRLELNYLNYLTSNFDEAREVFGPDSFLHEILTDLHKELGVKFLGFSAGGFGGVISMKELNEPTNPEASKGGQTRVPTMSPFRFAAEDMGFNPVSIPFAELYTSLQTGVVDGAIGTNAVDTYVGYADIAKYYYLYNNFFQATSFVMNERLWEELSDDHKEVIETAANNLSENSFEVAEESEQEHIQRMIDEGIEVVEFTEEEMEVFVEYAKEVTWPKLKDSLGEDVIDRLLSN